MSDKLIEVRKLKKHFPLRKGLFSPSAGAVRAVDGVDLHVFRGETLGLVGESGCGKSTTGRLILRLLEPTAGEVYFEDRELSGLCPAEVREMRRKMQVIFQDPYSSLDPRMTVENIVGEGLRIHRLERGRAKEEKILQLLETVGLQTEHRRRFPHEFSGGQRQRIGIARSLAVDPKLIICDEPVSALDVSIQAQIINLLKKLQKELKLTYLFISHDLSVIKHISDRVAVMYLGRIVELASKPTLYASPQHPYTQALLSAIPTMRPGGKKRRIILKGDVPSPVDPPAGCHFHPRCKEAADVCRHAVPELKDLGGGHFCACHMR